MASCFVSHHHLTMRFRTLEIRWHDSKPISTCDFQPAPLRRARPPGEGEERYTSHSYRLATGGEDNHVRVGLISPSLLLSDLRLWIGMDGIPKHQACVADQTRPQPCRAPPATNRVSCHTQSTFCSSQCCAILSQWYITCCFMLSCLELIVLAGELIASAGDGTCT